MVFYFLRVQGVGVEEVGPGRLETRINGGAVCTLYVLKRGVWYLFQYPPLYLLLLENFGKFVVG